MEGENNIFEENTPPSKDEQLLKIDEDYQKQLEEQIAVEKDEKMLDYLNRQKAISEKRMAETKERIAEANK